MKSYKEYKEILTDGQKEILKHLIDGENIFIAGNAGTGKSFLVDAFSAYCDENEINIVKVAPTGVAAQHIKGTTIHRQFGFKAKLEMGYTKMSDCMAEMEYDIDVMLIDEISMVRIEIFDKIIQVLNRCNRDRKRKGIKKIQLIVCGDFYQLPPVMPPADREALSEYYGCDIRNGFAFQSRYWKKYGLKMMKLEEVVRQDDKIFCRALEAIKHRNDKCIPWLMEHFSKKELEGEVWVCGKNATAKDKNSKELERLNGKKIISKAVYRGKVTAKDKLCDEVFEYKIGAKVMFLTNERGGDSYQNGTIGTIVDADDETGAILVKINDTGKTVSVNKQKFEKYEYVVTETEIFDRDRKGNIKKDENGEPLTKIKKQIEAHEIGSAIQYPLRLGYAITIHKSQGQTYGAMNFMPEIFSEGQLYVALSRSKAVEKIYIMGQLYPRMFMTSEEVEKFYSDPDNYDYFAERSSNKKEEKEPEDKIVQMALGI